MRTIACLLSSSLLLFCLPDFTNASSTGKPLETVEEPLAGDGSLDFLVGAWHVRGYAHVNKNQTQALDELMLCSLWSDGLVSGFKRSHFPSNSLDEDSQAAPALELLTKQPSATGYDLWDSEHQAWMSLCAWRPDYGDLGVRYARAPRSLLSPESELPNSSDFLKQRSGYENLSVDGWRFFVERLTSAGNWLRLCEINAERYDDQAAPQTESFEGGQDHRVETLFEGFTGSRGIAVDEEDNLYFGGRMGGLGDVPIYKLTPTGELTILARGLSPAGMVWHAGALYVHAHDQGQGRVVRLDSTGAMQSLGELPGDPLAIDDVGNAYTIVGDEILKLDAKGMSHVWLKSTLLNGTFALCWDKQGQSLIAGHWKSGVIYRLLEGEQPQKIGTIPGSSRGRCAWITMDGTDVLATSFGGSRVYRLAEGGQVSLVAGIGLPGNVDGPGRLARFHNPNGIAISRDGKTLWVAEIRPGPWGEFQHGRLRRILLKPN